MSPTRPRQTTQQIIQGDCLKVMADMESDSVDLIFGSPPYEDARTYGINFKIKGQDWVDWMVRVYEEASRVSKGLVAFVVQGRTRKFKWSCTPALLIADLHRAGFNVRRPVIFQRYGVPGSGGKEWLKCNHEYVVCVTPPGKLLWADNTACGHIPKYGPGGPCSNRKKNGSRVNQWGGTGKQTDRQKNGRTVNRKRPSHVFTESIPQSKTGHGRNTNGLLQTGKPYSPPTLCNPGDCLDFIDCGVVVDCGAVGAGHMGSALAHENEAPFPEKLAEFFIKSFCPPGGTVLDPFSGSGTTIAVTKKNYRNGIGIDVRESQIELGRKRLKEK